MAFVVCSWVLGVVAIEIVAEGEGDEETWDDDVS